MDSFVRKLFDSTTDLSTLTLRVVRERYVQHVGEKELSGEQKVRLKTIVVKQVASRTSSCEQPSPSQNRTTPDKQDRWAVEKGKRRNMSKPTGRLANESKLKEKDDQSGSRSKADVSSDESEPLSSVKTKKGWTRKGSDSENSEASETESEEEKFRPTAKRKRRHRTISDSASSSSEDDGGVDEKAEELVLSVETKVSPASKGTSRGREMKSIGTSRGQSGGDSEEETLSSLKTGSRKRNSSESFSDSGDGAKQSISCSSFYKTKSEASNGPKKRQALFEESSSEDEVLSSLAGKANRVADSPSFDEDVNLQSDSHASGKANSDESEDKTLSSLRKKKKENGKSSDLRGSENARSDESEEETLSSLRKERKEFDKSDESEDTRSDESEEETLSSLRRKKREISESSNESEKEQLEETKGSRSKPLKENATSGKIKRKVDSLESSSESEQEEVRETKTSRSKPKKENAVTKKRKVASSASSSESEQEEVRATKASRSKPLKENAIAGKKKRKVHSLDSSDGEEGKTSGRGRAEVVNESSMSSLCDTDVRSDAENQSPEKKKKKMPKSRSRDNKDTSKTESSSLARLKKIARAAGVLFPVHYNKVFAGCTSDRQREKRVKEELRKAGMIGRPSMAGAADVRLRREAEQLDTNNILPARASRTRRVEVKKDFTPVKQAFFSRIKGIVDSDGSDD